MDLSAEADARRFLLMNLSPCQYARWRAATIRRIERKHAVRERKAARAAWARPPVNKIDRD